MKSVSETKSFSQQIYERFQLSWMIDHGFTVKDLITVITECAGEIVSDDEPLYTEDVMELFEDTGFSGGSLYPCYDEFMDCEYQDASRIFPLLRDEEERKLYVQDLLADQDGEIFIPPLSDPGRTKEAAALMGNLNNLRHELDGLAGYEGCEDAVTRIEDAILVTISRLLHIVAVDQETKTLAIIK